MTHWDQMDAPDAGLWDRVAADLANVPSPVQMAEKAYLDARSERRRARDGQGSLAAAAALSREVVTGHALLIAKAEAGQCYRVGCREQVDMEYCDAHLTEVAS